MSHQMEVALLAIGEGLKAIGESRKEDDGLTQKQANSLIGWVVFGVCSLTVGWMVIAFTIGILAVTS